MAHCTHGRYLRRHVHGDCRCLRRERQPGKRLNHLHGAVIEECNLLELGPILVIRVRSVMPPIVIFGRTKLRAQDTLCCIAHRTHQHALPVSMLVLPKTAGFIYTEEVLS